MKVFDANKLSKYVRDGYIDRLLDLINDNKYPFAIIYNDYSISFHHTEKEFLELEGRFWEMRRSKKNQSKISERIIVRAIKEEVGRDTRIFSFVRPNKGAA